MLHNIENPFEIIKNAEFRTLKSVWMPDLLIWSVIILSYRAKNTIPYKGVQSVIAVKLSMMKIVCHWCIHEAADPRPVKISREQLVTQMSIDIKDYLKNHQQTNDRNMYWQYKRH